MAKPSSFALDLGGSHSSSVFPGEWLVNTAERRATHSGANQEGGAVQREGAGHPGQLWRETEKKKSAARDTERDVQEVSYHRSKAADPGYTMPAAQRGPFSRKKTGNPAPGGDRSRKSRPGRPLTHPRPPTHTAVWTWFTNSVRVPVRLHPRSEARLQFVARQTHGVEP